MAAMEHSMGKEEKVKERLSVTDRYYKRKYKIGKTEDQDVCVLAHSNRVCIITLAPSHPVVAKKKKVTSVSFDVSEANRLDNKVSGKGKKGAQWLKTASELCKIECEDGENYIFPAGLPAQLIEINENLVHSPCLLTEKPHTEGYIAIVLPKLKEYDYVMKRLSTEEAFKQARPDIT
ncbi:protein Abitram-like [Ylistrum balloti]|uniref:protein Abitram-like n=1 Tax=Ylistrum balloti TaxID=509963 RepID=UPI0029057DC5|nr:protein Abitram-like [Ylistrum balloti]